MSNVKTAISILWFLFTVVIGSYYFVLTNDVQNLEKELAQINSDIENKKVQKKSKSVQNILTMKISIDILKYV